MMDRRALLGTLGLLAAPHGADAQQVGRIHRVGFIGNATPSEGTTVSPTLKV